MYVKGTDIVFADVLLRPELNSLHALHTDTQVDYGAISQAQQADTELQALLSTDQPTSLVLRKVPLISTYY